jgi:SAM-dependent methyltransferase
MPFPNGYFSSAISNSVLEHIPQVEAVLNETARVLRSQAVFLFCVPNPRYLSELSIPSVLGKVGLKGVGERYRQWFRKMSRVEHAVPPQTWQTWLEEAGFTLERWWHYFSPASMRALEWGHYLGAPTLLPHALIGRWIIIPRRWNLALTERLVRPYSQPHPYPDGTFTFFVARKL